MKIIWVEEGVQMCSKGGGVSLSTNTHAILTSAFRKINQQFIKSIDKLTKKRQLVVQS